jgi:hypothetical protein
MKTAFVFSVHFAVDVLLPDGTDPNGGTIHKMSKSHPEWEIAANMPLVKALASTITGVNVYDVVGEDMGRVATLFTTLFGVPLYGIGTYCKVGTGSDRETESISAPTSDRDWFFLSRRPKGSKRTALDVSTLTK